MRRRQALARLAGWWMLLGVCFSMSGLASGQQASAVPALDLNRFFGTWFEIARLPNRAEKKCVGDAFQMYASAYKPAHFQVVDSCTLKDRSKDVRNINGKRASKTGDGKLKLGSFFPFTSKLWVLAMAPDDSWALVGSPNHKSLWVLARTATISPGVLAEAESKASSEGFKTARLVLVSQQP